jgi:hypothetical protein
VEATYRSRFHINIVAGSQFTSKGAISTLVSSVGTNVRQQLLYSFCMGVDVVFVCLSIYGRYG